MGGLQPAVSASAPSLVVDAPLDTGYNAQYGGMVYLPVDARPAVLRATLRLEGLDVSATI
jgi:hypothetical protein